MLRSLRNAARPYGGPAGLASKVVATWRAEGAAGMVARVHGQLRGIVAATMHGEAAAGAVLARVCARSAAATRTLGFRGSDRFTVRGYCPFCGWGPLLVTDLHAHRRDDGELEPSWREQAVCHCGLNTRMRSTLDWLRTHERLSRSSRVYCTEAATPFFRALRGNFPDAVGSEYIPSRAAVGTIDALGVRCEDLERLTFAEGRFEAVVTLDVLEHVFDWDAAIREMYRVLAPGGVLVATVPFFFGRGETVRRAHREGDRVVHDLPPVYHGDPISASGALVVSDYGWDLVRRMREIGFRDVAFIHLFSAPKMYVGLNYILRAVKPRGSRAGVEARP